MPVMPVDTRCAVERPGRAGGRGVQGEQAWAQASAWQEGSPITARHARLPFDMPSYQRPRAPPTWPYLVRHLRAGAVNDRQHDSDGRVDQQARQAPGGEEGRRHRVWATFGPR